MGERGGDIAAGIMTILSDDYGESKAALVMQAAEEIADPLELTVEEQSERRFPWQPDEDKWSTEDLNKLDRQIEGFTKGSTTTQAMYVGFMVTGALILGLVYPLIAFNEYKQLNLYKAFETIDEYLFLAGRGGTCKENNNKLVFAQGPLSFPNPAKDDLLGFQSDDGITLYRNVEIYQWVRKLDDKSLDADEPFRYEKIWSQRLIDSSDYPGVYQNPTSPPMPFRTDVFYGEVQLGDFTLNHQQMNDILEPESWTALSKDQISKVLKMPDAEYKGILDLHGLTDFKLVQIEKESSYQKDEYLLYAKSLESMKHKNKQKLDRSVTNRRSSVKKQRDRSGVESGENSMNNSIAQVDKSMLSADKSADLLNVDRYNNP